MSDIEQRLQHLEKLEDYVKELAERVERLERPQIYTKWSHTGECGEGCTCAKSKPSVPELHIEECIKSGLVCACGKCIQERKESISIPREEYESLKEKAWKYDELQ